MDLCEHAFYKPEEKYTPRLYCKIEDKMCIYSKRCFKVDRFMPEDGNHMIYYANAKIKLYTLQAASAREKS